MGVTNIDSLDERVESIKTRARDSVAPVICSRGYAGRIVERCGQVPICRVIGNLKSTSPVTALIRTQRGFCHTFRVPTTSPESSYAFRNKRRPDERPLRSAALVRTDFITCFRKSKIDECEHKYVSEQRDDAGLRSCSSTSHPFRALERWVQQVPGNGDATVGDSVKEALSPIPRGVHANGEPQIAGPL